jgi:ammonium transporter, Amt family
MCVSIISFQVVQSGSQLIRQWFFWGYSLTFSHTAGRFIGNLNNFGMINTLGAASVGSAWIPDLLFNLFQLVFAA